MHTLEKLAIVGEILHRKSAKKKLTLWVELSEITIILFGAVFIPSAALGPGIISEVLLELYFI